MRALRAVGLLLCSRYIRGCRAKLNSYGLRIISHADETALESLHECAFSPVDRPSRTPLATAPARRAQGLRQPLLAGGIAGPAPRCWRRGQVHPLTSDPRSAAWPVWSHG